MRTVVIVFVLMLSAFPPVTSQASADDIMIAGIGSQPCTSLIANILLGDGFAANGFTKGYMSWMQGYVSGANAVKINSEKKFFDLSTVSYDEQWAFFVESCRRNPGQPIFAAVEDMMLHRLRVIPAPPPNRPVKR
jgi:hypothetical protein